METPELSRLRLESHLGDFLNNFELAFKEGLDIPLMSEDGIWRLRNFGQVLEQFNERRSYNFASGLQGKELDRSITVKDKLHLVQQGRQKKVVVTCENRTKNFHVKIFLPRRWREHKDTTSLDTSGLYRQQSDATSTCTTLKLHYDSKETVVVDQVHCSTLVTASFSGLDLMLHNALRYGGAGDAPIDADNDNEDGASFSGLDLMLHNALRHGDAGDAPIDADNDNEDGVNVAGDADPEEEISEVDAGPNAGGYAEPDGGATGDPGGNPDDGGGDPSENPGGGGGGDSGGNPGGNRGRRNRGRRNRGRRNRGRRNSDPLACCVCFRCFGKLRPCMSGCSHYTGYLHSRRYFECTECIDCAGCPGCEPSDTCQHCTHFGHGYVNLGNRVWRFSYAHNKYDFYDIFDSDRQLERMKMKSSVHYKDKKPKKRGKDKQKRRPRQFGEAKYFRDDFDDADDECCSTTATTKRGGSSTSCRRRQL